jgi:hypothetical protein
MVYEVNLCHTCSHTFVQPINKSLRFSAPKSVADVVPVCAWHHSPSISCALKCRKARGLVEPCRRAICPQPAVIVLLAPRLADQTIIASFANALLRGVFHQRPIVAKKARQDFLCPSGFLHRHDSAQKALASV